jgi:hypothetical protein
MTYFANGGLAVTYTMPASNQRLDRTDNLDMGYAHMFDNLAQKSRPITLTGCRNTSRSSPSQAQSSPVSFRLPDLC